MALIEGYFTAKWGSDGFNFGGLFIGQKRRLIPSSLFYQEYTNES
jgi:hypothetical protein